MKKLSLREVFSYHFYAYLSANFYARGAVLRPGGRYRIVMILGHLAAQRLVGEARRKSEYQNGTQLRDSAQIDYLVSLGVQIVAFEMSTVAVKVSVLGGVHPNP